MKTDPNHIKRKDFLDRSSPLPAYQQIANDLITRISQKEWSVKDRLPSETDLALEYGVSRVTLRQAMAQLERENIIERFQGKGAFVKSNPRPLIQELVFPSLDVLNRYPNPVKPKVIKLEHTAAPNHSVQENLQIGAGESLTYLQRIFYHQDRPTGVNNIWFRTRDVPDLSPEHFLDNSISKTLKFAYHYEVTEIENYIESVRLDAVTAALLGTVYDATGLKIDSQYLLADKTPIEFSSTIWLGDFTRFHYKVNK